MNCRKNINHFEYEKQYYLATLVENVGELRSKPQGHWMLPPQRIFRPYTGNSRRAVLRSVVDPVLLLQFTFILDPDLQAERQAKIFNILKSLSLSYS